MGWKIQVKLVVVAANLHAQGALAQSIDGQYKALLSCDKLPFTKGRLENEPVTLAVSAGKVTYSRTLYGYDREAIVGKEVGAGSVAEDGTIELSGGWQRGTDSLKATYHGKISGGFAQLKGKHVISYQGKSYDRVCSISLSPSK